MGGQVISTYYIAHSGQQYYNLQKRSTVDVEHILSHVIKELVWDKVQYTADSWLLTQQAFCSP